MVLTFPLFMKPRYEKWKRIEKLLRFKNGFANYAGISKPFVRGRTRIAFNDDYTMSRYEDDAENIIWLGFIHAEFVIKDTKKGQEIYVFKKRK